MAVTGFAEPSACRVVRLSEDAPSRCGRASSWTIEGVDPTGLEPLTTDAAWNFDDRQEAESEIAWFCAWHGLPPGLPVVVVTHTAV
jgi:hypothetical protein